MQTESANQEVLYLSYDGLTDTLGQSQILPYLIGLADAGYSISIISFEKSYRLDAYRDNIEGLCKGRGLHWIPLKYHKYPPVLSTLYDLLRLRRTVKKVLMDKKVTIIHCRSYLPSLTGLWAKRRRGIKFIFDMRGFWVDERIDGGLWNLKNPIFKLIYHFFKRKEKQFVKEADHIVVLTENGKSEIQSWAITSVPISVIPTCVDMQLFHPEKGAVGRKSLRQQLSISETEFVLVYLGSWGTWYLTDEILAFFSVLVCEQPNSRLLVLSPDLPDLRDYAFSSKVIIKSATRNEVPRYLGLADASVCFIKQTFSKKGSSATKIAEALAMDLPVVTNGGWGDIERLRVSGFPLHICNSPGDYPRVAKLLTGRENVRGYRRLLYGRFDLDSGIKEYKRIYRSLSVL